MAAEGFTQMEALRNGGFPQEEVDKWAADRASALVQGGFSQEEVKDYFGVKDPDTSAMKGFVKENLAAAKAEQAEKANPDQKIKAGPKVADDWMESLEAGWQMSVSGLVGRGKGPDVINPADAGTVMEVASQIGTLAGDLPAMVTGGIFGGVAGATGGAAVGTMAGSLPGTAAGAVVGGVVGADVGANALPATLRKIMMDHYEKGDIQNFSEFWDRLSATTWETVKGGAVGAATMGAGRYVGPVANKAGGAVVGALTKTASEIGTMVTVGKALEGKMPNASDFLNAGIVIGGLHGALKIGGKLRSNFAETGEMPHDVVEKSVDDVTIKQELVSDKPTPAEVAEIPNPDKPLAVEKPSTWAKVYQSAIDDLTPLEKATTELKAGELPAGKDPYKLARTFKDWNGKATRFMEYDTLDFKTGKKNGEGLKAIFKDIPNEEKIDLTDSEKQVLTRVSADALEGKGNTWGKLTAYLLSKRAIEKAGQGIETGIDLEHAEAVVSDGKGKYDKIAKRLYEFQDRALQYAVDAELIPEKDAAKIREMNKDYIPFHRLQEEDPFQPKKGKAGKPLKLMKGSEREILDPIESVVKNTKALIRAAEKNRILKSLVELQENAPQGEDLYHGTPEKFSGFNKDQSTYFTSDEAVAKRYASERIIGHDGNGEPIFSKGGEVVKAKIKGETLDLTSKKNWPDKLVKALAESSDPHSKALYEDLKKDGKLSHNKWRDYEKSPELKKYASENGVGKIKHLDSHGNEKGEAFLVHNRQSIEVDGKAEPLFKKVKASQRPIKVSSEEVIKFMESQGIETDGVDAEGMTIFRPSVKGLADNEFQVMRSGKREVWAAREEYAPAIQALDYHPGQTSMWYNVFVKGPATALRAGTALAPDFILRNFFRDQLTAGVYSKYKMIPFTDTLQSIKHMWKKDNVWQEFLSSGGASGGLAELTHYFEGDLSALHSETGVMEKAWNVIKSPLQALHVTSALIENVPRVAEFKKAGGVDGNFDTKIQAALDSREVTLDFARSGAKMRAVNAVIPFLNVGVQGTDRLVREFKENPVKATAKATASLTLPTMMLWWANKDDSRYKDAPRWQKDLFWLVPTDKWEKATSYEDAASRPDDLKRQKADGSWEVNNGHVFRLPKPFEVGVLFASLPERTLDALYQKEGENAFKEFGNTILQGLTPNLLPTAVVPIAEQMLNRSFFLGNQIVTPASEKLLPEYQYDAYTSETAKQVAKMIGYVPFIRDVGSEDAKLASPQVIDNYIRVWSGTMGAYAVQLLDKGLHTAGIGSPVPGPASTLADVPFVKAFMLRYPSAKVQPIQDFYDNYKDNERHYNTVKMLAEKGESAKAQALMNEAPEKMARFTEVRKALTQAHKAIDSVNADPAKSPSDKRQLIDTIYYQMLSIAKAGNKAMRDFEKQVKMTTKKGE